MDVRTVQLIFADRLKQTKYNSFMLHKEPLMVPYLKDKYPELIGLSISLSTTIDKVNSIVDYHHSLDPKDYSAYIDCRLTYSPMSLKSTTTDQQFGANNGIVCPETGPW